MSTKSEMCLKNIMLPQHIGTDYNFKRKIVWLNVVSFLFMHLGALYGLLRIGKCETYTLIWVFVLLVLSGEGITLGAHRLYSHKSFKASFIVRLFVIVFQTIAGQNCLYVWVRDHRLHHKYSDTDADPHNASRGFFFSHIGWLMSKKHPAVIEKGRTLDMSDLQQDKLVMMQKKYFKLFYLVFGIVLPVGVPMYQWNESVLNSVFVCYLLRYIISLNVTWLINSAAHIYGVKPYDNKINPTQNYFTAVVSLGEGWHNYHHVFPQDYKAAEFGLAYSFTTFVIDMLAFFGLVSGLKQASHDAIKFKAMQKGDGTHVIYGNMGQKVE